MCAGPKIGKGYFARPHLLQLIAELAGILSVQQTALKRHASPVSGVQASLACLLSAAASLLEAARLLEQPDGNSHGAAADNEGAADLIAAVPSYLSLACDVLQGHPPPEVRCCCNILARPATYHVHSTPTVGDTEPGKQQLPACCLSHAWIPSFE